MTTVDRPAIPAVHFSIALNTLCLLASIVSLILVMQGATDEPYVTFRPAEALSQIGLGCALITIWLFLVVAVCYGVFTHRLARWWLLLVLWAAIAVYHLRLCPFGYVEDLCDMFRCDERSRPNQSMQRTPTRCSLHTFMTKIPHPRATLAPGGRR